MIKTSLVFWQGALAVRSQIDGGKRLSPTPPFPTAVPFPRHCGAPRPEKGERILAQSPRALRLCPRGTVALESSVFEGQRSRKETLGFQRLL